jgi:hypothetical protein
MRTKNSPEPRDQAAASTGRPPLRTSGEKKRLSKKVDQRSAEQPFATFEEWFSEADKSGYHDL